jgi:hypothetical protein
LTRATRIAVRHHHDHWLRFVSGDQIVEDEIGVALTNPTSFVLSAAVLQVKHWIALLSLRVIAGW